MSLRKNLRSLYPLVASLFDTPSATFKQEVLGARVQIQKEVPLAGEHLSAFADEVEMKKVGELEEIYNHTFCLMPLCVPYVSVHLFAEESFQRTAFMCLLKEAYQKEAFSEGQELPDHLAVLLRFAPKFSAEEWHEMVTCCLEKAVKGMLEKLKDTQNIYRHPLQALQCLLEREVTHV